MALRKEEVVVYTDLLVLFSHEINCHNSLYEETLCNLFPNTRYNYTSSQKVIFKDPHGMTHSTTSIGLHRPAFIPCRHTRPCLQTYTLQYINQILLPGDR
jgi:hypothetical protein